MSHDDTEGDRPDTDQGEILDAFAVLSGRLQVGTTAEIQGVTLEKRQDGEWWAVFDGDEIADVVDFASLCQAKEVVNWCYQFKTGDGSEDPEPPQQERRELQ